MDAQPPSDRTRLRRKHQRGHYDRATIDAILDTAFVCHVGYVIEGAPYVIPTLCWREGDHLYWHGSAASRMLREADGAEVCVTVTLVDGLVLARSGFRSSANYRSVMLFGRAFRVKDEAEKAARLDAFIDGLCPGRAAEVRPATAQELKATTLLGIEISEASAKVRDGDVGDDEADYALPVWAGVVPLRTVAGEPEPDTRLAPGTALPAHVQALVARFA